MVLDEEWVIIAKKSDAAFLNKQTRSPFSWGTGMRLLPAAVLASGLWIAVGWALDWW